MQVCDLRALADIAHKYGALVMVDNSIMTPVYQRPLDLGADISMISATKFIGGHSDVTGGILSVKGKELADRCALYTLLPGCWSTNECIVGRFHPTNACSFDLDTHCHGDSCHQASVATLVFSGGSCSSRARISLTCVPLAN